MLRELKEMKDGKCDVRVGTDEVRAMKCVYGLRELGGDTHDGLHKPCVGRTHAFPGLSDPRVWKEGLSQAFYAAYSSSSHSNSARNTYALRHACTVPFPTTCMTLTATTQVKDQLTLYVQSPPPFPTPPSPIILPDLLLHSLFLLPSPPTIIGLTSPFPTPSSLSSLSYYHSKLLLPSPPLPPSLASPLPPSSLDPLPCLLPRWFGCGGR
ncbi:hypothetical protein Pcinc_031423 [Petrolisthes cinctipes]|uniref:Uncharacterized protein n=1 Tax=Petrolisthes cinctipes TaxID=88211 RepID=A0AAE1EWE8_PETCI|nr:hypothetical protein Pcinc_031423 [Petrolisthes cinctipes]